MNNEDKQLEEVKIEFYKILNEAKNVCIVAKLKATGASIHDTNACCGNIQNIDEISKRDAELKWSKERFLTEILYITKHVFRLNLLISGVSPQEAYILTKEKFKNKE